MIRRRLFHKNSRFDDALLRRFLIPSKRIPTFYLRKLFGEILQKLAEEP